MKRMHYRLSLALMLVFVIVGASALAQITPSQDSYTNTADPTTNYGTATTLGVVSSATSIQTTYIQFDLSSIPVGYTSSNVAKATLKLYVNGVATAGSFNLDFVNGSWTEKTITSSLAPALGTTIASSVPLTAAKVHDYVLLDVTSAVGEWLNGSQANDGLALVANSPLSATFDSKENTTQSHPAELDIVFTSGGTISGVTTASGSGLTGGGTSGSLSIGLLKTCAANQVLQWSGSVWICASAGTGTVTSVGLAAPSSDFKVSASPVTGTGTLNFDWNVAPSSANNGNAIVKRDANGDFAASTVTGINVDATNVNASFLSGNGSGLTNVNAAQLGGHPASYFANIVANTFGSPQLFNGNGNTATVGDMGCGSGFVGIALYGGVNCDLYSIMGDTAGNLYLNRPSGGTVHVRENNGDEMTILTGGTVVMAGDGAFYHAELNVNATLEGASGIDVGGGGGGSSAGFGGNGVNAYGGYESTSAQNSQGGDGVVAQGGTGAAGGAGVTAVGGYGPSITGPGIYASTAQTTGTSGAAGYFAGDVVVEGTLAAGAKQFKIDHPLDPANKYLVHSSVESSEMMNIYTGNVTLDASGEATVQLPEWFEAENTDFRYSLACVGGFAPVYVAEEISANHFKLAGGKPGMKVSWQVTGVRQDAYAKAHPLVVEEEKDAQVKGFYIHPELYRAPDEKQIEWARNPQRMKWIKEQRAKAAERATTAAAKKP